MLALARPLAIALTLLAHAQAQDQEVKVGPPPPSTSTSSGAAADRLRPSGSTESPIDWRTIPPWRQTSFFGVRAQGQVFIYVVDCSGSMADGRLARAKAELRRSIGDLRWPQRFHIIFFNEGPVPLPGGLPRPADLKGKRQMVDWLRLIEPDGGTNPGLAMEQALSLQPDAIFLLSDGEFPAGSVAAIAAQNRAHVPIHCIDLAGNGRDLPQIARDSGGQYRSRPH